MRLLPWATKWTRTPLTAGPFREGMLQVESLHRSMKQCLLKGIQGQVGPALQICSCNTMHLYHSADPASIEADCNDAEPTTTLAVLPQA